MIDSISNFNRSMYLIDEISTGFVVYHELVSMKITSIRRGNLVDLITISHNGQHDQEQLLTLLKTATCDLFNRRPVSCPCSFHPGEGRVETKSGEHQSRQISFKLPKGYLRRYCRPII